MIIQKYIPVGETAKGKLLILFVANVRYRGTQKIYTTACFSQIAGHRKKW
jgi:hypothetical protein